MTDVTDATHAPRMLPLTPEERSPAQAELLRGRIGELGIFATLARHPDLYAAWLPFGEQLLRKGLLTDRARELLIMRTAFHCRAVYEWGHHIPFSLKAGLSREEIERIAVGPDAPGLPPADALLLRAADELYADRRVGDDTWAGLAASYDERELIEILLLVGQYTLVAGALNSLGVRLEDGYEQPSWADR